MSTLLSCVVNLPDELRIERQEFSEAKEVRWLVFHASKRGAQGKLIAQLGSEDDRKGFIKAISVRPKYRGHNLTQKMLEMCKDFMRDDLQYDFVWLEAEEDMSRFGKLVALYESAGFRVIETGGPFKMLYNGDETFRVVPMGCELGLAVAKHLYTLAHALQRRETVRSSDSLFKSVWDVLTSTRGLAKAAKRMRLAESNGHPDWVQFLALIQHLGSLSSHASWEAAIENNSEKPLSSVWLADLPPSASDAMAIGCGSDVIDALTQLGTSETRPPQPAPHSGLESLQPIWNEDEYLYEVLHKNGCLLPHIGYQMLRFRRLDKFLQAGFYDEFLAASDRGLLMWIHRYSQLCSQSLEPAVCEIDLDEQVSASDLKRAQTISNKFALEPWAW
mmetsp:Transcript_12630/g.24496  ORF Transcript_12630/g.24496 Transcript_12630/m.24496 type:complete len:389 (-) Transcript_12630:159-1325(-)|eukprot:CAMPEP_0171484458 /NCGR_PEP_ID=MMETSP0958-20121227/14_1 /TAXON_ID=87120 /ORGANISM="Aurantiochytrium limacinum, Strain ATCCMYA-1381" /LENGTH=388 /DNA_ID=CAMNT_0012017165 /DNA_START=335 /DNA_END=1501 /DNA_ORIENTATION=+